MFNWKDDEVLPSPFEGHAKDMGGSRIYLSETRAVNDSDINTALHEIIEKSLSLASCPLDKNVSICLFEWDSVYSMLTVSFFDKDMVESYHDVIRCSFLSWDDLLESISDDDLWEDKAEELSQKVKVFLTKNFRSCHRSTLPENLNIYFSDKVPTEDPFDLLNSPELS